MIQIEELYSLFLQYPEIATDTRKATHNSIFFCLKGEHFNGNTFAQSALDKGARYAVIDDPDFMSVNNTLLVDNVLQCLQKLALFHREKFNIPVIGITGSNGKTTTKELITSVLSKKFAVTATKGNLNNHIGVPLTLLSITSKTEIAVIEMGANHFGEIEELCAMVLPNSGIITNIGKAHLEGFTSFEKITETKTALYRSVASNNGVVFVNGDNDSLVSLAKNIHYIIYASSHESFCPGKLTEANPYVSLKWGVGLHNNLQTNLIGAYNFENIMAAACIGLYYGVSEPDINNALADYQPSNMRSQLVKSKTNTIILDTYNANPASMKAALDNFESIKFDKKVVILGDMLELGNDKETEHNIILSRLKLLNCYQVFLVGPLFFQLNNSPAFNCFKRSDDARAFLKSNQIQDSVVLIKGSRGIMLEKLMDVL